MHTLQQHILSSSPANRLHLSGDLLHSNSTRTLRLQGKVYFSTIQYFGYPNYDNIIDKLGCSSVQPYYPSKISNLSSIKVVKFYVQLLKKEQAIIRLLKATQCPPPQGALIILKFLLGMTNLFI
jgi:hypothetical protein